MNEENHSILRALTIFYVAIKKIFSKGTFFLVIIIFALSIYTAYHYNDQNQYSAEEIYNIGARNTSMQLSNAIMGQVTNCGALTIDGADGQTMEVRDVRCCPLCEVITPEPIIETNEE